MKKRKMHMIQKQSQQEKKRESECKIKAVRKEEKYIRRTECNGDCQQCQMLQRSEKEL